MYVLKKSDLNAPQYEAAVHLEGPMLVLAGAGSGKTRVITRRIAYLVSKGVPPEQIVAVSFTNKAANEMQTRVSELIGSPLAKQCILSTFHSLGAQILRKDIKHLGYRNPFAILDVNDQKSVLKDLLKEMKLGGAAADLDKVLGTLSKAKNVGGLPSKLPGMRLDPNRFVVDKIFQRYTSALKALNAVDFDDLIGLPIKLFTEHPEVLARYQASWLYLMVDEYQDTNHTQFVLLEQLAGTRKNVVVVGDDDQSIYAFRGAVSDHILSFEKHFAGARVIALEQNYRSTQTILEASNAVIAGNRKRRDKKLWSAGEVGKKLRHFNCRDEVEEAAFVADRILLMRAELNLKYQDFAILYRINPQSRVFEEALRERSIPYRMIGGTKFFDRREVKDIVFYLRVCVNPSDELALRRIVNIPRRGVGPGTIADIDELARAKSISFFQALEEAPNKLEIPQARARQKLQEFTALITEFRAKFHQGGQPLHKIAQDLIERLNYIDHIRAMGGKDEFTRQRVDNVLEVINAIASFENRSHSSSLVTFLERITLDPSTDEDDEQNKVTMMTLHSAKGLEFPAVFMVGCEEGLLPHSRSIKERGGVEEERRLCYVGMTRAKRHLTLSSCLTRLRRGETYEQEVSRFLTEIPERTIERSDDVNSKAAVALKEVQQTRDRGHLAALRAAIFKD